MKLGGSSFHTYQRRQFSSAILFLGLMLLPLWAVAQSSLPPCPEAGFKDNCLGTITLLNGGKYIGEFRANVAHGNGRLVLPNGMTYVGEFRAHNIDGQGILYRADGTVSDSGTWLGLALKRSHQVDPNIFPLNRVGTLTAPNGESYVGEIRNQEPFGQGAYTFANGDKYVGEFREGKFNGLGTYTFLNGDEYIGDFRNGKLNGKGTFSYANGDQNVGGFQSGKFSGSGVLYGKDGSIIKTGTWNDGQLASVHGVDPNRFAFNPTRLRIAQQQASAVNRNETERERLAAAVEAERRNGKELEEALAAPQSQSSARPEAPANVRSAHALVIGNAAYPGSARLDNPVNDANAISQKLRSMGFTVTTVTDANRLRLVQAMTQFRRTAASADLSLLFYSGHGIQIFGTNYILPTDVDQTDAAQATIQGVSLNSVVENFLPGKTKLVFLDACRDNPLQRTADRSVSKGLAPISVAQGTLISYATKDGQTASDGPGARNSPFTQALLQHLDDPSDIAVVLRKVREKVMQATGGKQQPWEYGSLTGGELVLARIGGRFK